MKSDKGGAFISKEYKEFCKTQNIRYIYDTANLHTGTGLVERTIQSLKNLTLECIGKLNLLKAQLCAFNSSESTTIPLTVQNWQITS